MANRHPDKVALIEWTHLIEDFLGNIGLTIDDFTEKMTGGWLFGYVEALKKADVDTVLFCFSAKIKVPLHLTHKPTGAAVCILPSPLLYRSIRKVIVNPYTQIVEEAVANTTGWKRWWQSILLSIAPYCATPLLSFCREIKKYKCSAILCQDYEHARFDICVMLGRFLSLPVVATFQGGNWQMSKVEKWLRPLTIKACKGLIIASGVELARVKNKYNLQDGRMKTIFNPVEINMGDKTRKDEVRNSLSINRDKRIAIWHGRIDYHRKGLDILIDAWEIVCAKNNEEKFELILIGSGVNAEILRLRLAQSTVTNIIWINEYINDRTKINQYLKAADIYVFPSRNEGFPVAPLEAMACGLPLIATDAPGIVDILPLGEHSGGIVLQREDTRALAAAILNLLQDKEKVDRLGQNAANNIQQNFSFKAVGIQLKEFMFKNE